MAIKKVDIDRNLPISSNLRLYNVLVDENGDRFVNIFRAYSVNENAKFNKFLYNEYQTEHEDWWDNIASRYYETPYMWWAVATYNDIINPYEDMNEGTLVKILRKDLLYVLFDDIAEIERL